MTTYLTNRDGGKTNEEGHIRFQTKAWDGNVVSGLQALQRSPLAMGINISIGDAKVDYSTYGYTVWTDAVEVVSIATADPSNPRIDRIVAYVDLAVTPSTANINNPSILKFKAVAGTPAASPSRPSDVTVQASVGASNPYFNIADVLVGTGVTTISTANITDTRVFISPSYVEGANIAASSIPNSALAGGITGDKLATSAIFLSYDATTGTNQSGITTEVAITGLSSTVTVPAGGRSVKITFSGQYYGGDVAQTALKCDGSTVKSGRFVSGAVTSLQFTMMAFHAPAAGSHTYTASVTRIVGSGSITLENSVAPCDILVELV